MLVYENANIFHPHHIITHSLPRCLLDCIMDSEIPEYSSFLATKIRFLQTGLVFTGEASFLRRQIVRLLRWHLISLRKYVKYWAEYNELWRYWHQARGVGFYFIKKWKQYNYHEAARYTDLPLLWQKSSLPYTLFSKQMIFDRYKKAPCISPVIYCPSKDNYVAT